MNFKPVGIFLAIVGVLALIVVMGAISQGEEAVSGSNQGSRNEFGTSPYGIVFTEAYSLGCPKCKTHHEQYLDDYRKEYGDKIVFKFKHFPLKSSWPHVLAGHRAVEAAARQNKFFEMQDKLYEVQLDWRDESNPVPLFKEIAKDLGMDVEQFETDFKSKEVFDIINNDEKELKRKGVTETPTIFIKKGTDREEEKADGDDILNNPNKWFTDLLAEFEDDNSSADDEPAPAGTDGEKTDDKPDDQGSSDNNQ